MSDPLDEALGIDTPLPERRAPIVPERETSDVDYEFARANLYRATTKIEDALDELANIARSSEHPRAYEVYANLAKTFIDVNKDILELRRTHKETTSEASRTGDGPKTVNNNLVIGSDDLLRKVKAMIKGDAPAVVIDAVAEPVMIESKDAE